MSTTPADLEKQNEELRSVISKMHLALLTCRSEKTPYGIVKHYDNKKINDAIIASEDIFLESSSTKLLSAIETVRFSSKAKAS